MPKQLLCCVCFECNSEGLTFEVESFFDRDVKAAKCIGCKGKDKLIIKGCFLTRHYCYECAIVQKQLEAASEQTEDEAIEQQKNGIKEKRKRASEQSTYKGKKSKLSHTKKQLSTTACIEEDSSTTAASESIKDDDEMTKKSDLESNITSDNKDDDMGSESFSPNEKSDESKNNTDHETQSSEDYSPKAKTKKSPKKEDVLVNNFMANMDYLRAKDSTTAITHQDEFLLSNTPNNDTVDIIVKIIECYSKTEKEKKKANVTANRIELQIMEEWVFFHLDVNKIETESFILHYNEIIASLNTQCSKISKEFDFRVPRRWSFVLVLRIIRNVWPGEEEEGLKDKDEATESSSVFINIVELIREACTSFPLLRKVSINRCVKLNNSHAFRQNKLSHSLENISGTEKDQANCDKVFDEITEKRQKSIAKSAKVTKSTAANGIEIISADSKKANDENSVDKFFNSSGISQNDIDEFFKPRTKITSEKKEIINCDHLSSLSLDELLARFSNLFTGGIDAFAKVLLSSSANGSATLLDIDSITKNELVLQKLVALFENYSPRLHQQNILGDILTSSDITYMIFKFVNPKEGLSVIRSDGFCYYRTIFLSFHAYVQHPFEISDDDCIEDRFTKRTAFVLASGNLSLFEGQSKFRTEFMTFWISIKMLLLNENHMAILITRFEQYGMNEFLSFQEESLFNTLLTKVLGMLKLLDDNKDKDERSLPKGSWLEANDVRLLGFLISYIYSPKKQLNIDPSKPFLFNIFEEISVTNDHESIIKSTLQDNADNLPSQFKISLWDGEKVCYFVLSHSTVRLDSVLSEAKRKFTFDELARITDPSANLVNRGSHTVLFKDFCLYSDQIFELITKTGKSIADLLIKPIDNFDSNDPPLQPLLQPLTSKQINRRVEQLTSPTPRIITTIPTAELPKGELTVAYINSRHAEILSELKKRTKDSVAVDFVRDNSIEQVGSLTLYDLRTSDLALIADPNDYTMINTCVISAISTLANIESFGRLSSSKIAVVDIHTVSLFARKIVDNILYTKEVISCRRDMLVLRMKYASVLLFPFCYDVHFMLFIMFPFFHLICCFDSFTSDSKEKLDLKIRVMKNLVGNYNSIHSSSRQQTKAYDEWEIVIDGHDTDVSIPQQGPTHNCGVYVCCYIMIIAFHLDTDQLIELFRSKAYHSLFDSINPDTIIHHRKLLTVKIVDRERN